MTAVTVTVDDTEVRAALAALAQRAGNPRPFLLAIGEDIMERAKRRFETSTDPAGRRWQPNAHATIEAWLDARSGQFAYGACPGSYEGVRGQVLHYDISDRRKSPDG